MNLTFYAAKSQGAHPLPQRSLLHCFFLHSFTDASRGEGTLRMGTVPTGEPLLLSESMPWMLTQHRDQCKVEGPGQERVWTVGWSLSFCRWRVCGYFYKVAVRTMMAQERWMLSSQVSRLQSSTVPHLPGRGCIRSPWEWVALLTSQRSSDIILQFILILFSSEPLGLPKLFLSSTYVTPIFRLMINSCFYLLCHFLWRPICWRPYIRVLGYLHYSSAGCTTV